MSQAIVPSWGGLPTELKVEIIRHRVVFHKPITRLLHHVLSQRALVPLALTSREFAALAQKAYYSENTFLLERAPRERSDAVDYRLSWWVFLFPHPQMIPNIHNLVFKLHVAVDDRYGGRHPLDWNFLLDYSSNLSEQKELPEQGLYQTVHMNRQAQTKWQRHFRLQELKIILAIDNPWSVLKSPQQTTALIKETLRGASVVLQADKVEVGVEGIICPSYTDRSHPALCNEECTQILASAIKDLFSKE